MPRQSKKAVATDSEAPEPMANHNNLNESYHHSPYKSSGKLKEQIGELILYLQTPRSHHEQQKCWVQFESMLKRYVDLESCGVAL